jgi:hypothetical protein
VATCQRRGPPPGAGRGCRLMAEPCQRSISRTGMRFWLPVRVFSRMLKNAAEMAIAMPRHAENPMFSGVGLGARALSTPFSASC